MLGFSGKATATTSEPWRAFRGYDHKQQTRIYVITNANTAFEWLAACQALPGAVILIQ